MSSRPSPKTLRRDGPNWLAESRRLQTTPSTEAAEPATKLKFDSKIDFRQSRSFSMKDEDFRQEENINRGSKDGLVRTGAYEEEEIGFEVQMTAGSQSRGDTQDESSERSSLDFSLSKLSGSGSVYDNIKTAYDNFKTFTKHSGDGADPAIASPDCLSPDTDIEQSSKAPRLSRRSQPLFVDVDAEPRRMFSDDTEAPEQTPRTNNRSEAQAQPFSSPPKTPILLSRKKEDVANTMATISQRLDSPSENCHNSSAVSGLVVQTSQAHNAKKGAPMDHQKTDPQSRVVEDADTAHEASSWEETMADDSSAEVDRRWLKLRAKILKEDEEPNVIRLKFQGGHDDQQSETSDSKGDGSGEDDAQFDEMRATLLEVNSVTSPRSHVSVNSDAFEDELIQDCVETGLPTPKSKEASKNTTTSAMHEATGKESVATTQTVPTPPTSIGSEKIPDHSEEPSQIYPASLPALNLRPVQKEVEEVSERTEEGPGLDVNLQMVPSGLTVEGEGDQDIHHDEKDESPFTDVASTGEPVDGGIIPAISSCSDNATFPAGAAARLEAVISSDTESVQQDDEYGDLTPVPSMDAGKAPVIRPTASMGSGNLVLPQKALNYDNESVQGQRIEVTLAPSLTDSERSDSKASQDFEPCAETVHTESHVDAAEEKNPSNDENSCITKTETSPLHKNITRQASASKDVPSGRLGWWRKHGKQAVSDILSTPLSSSMPPSNTENGENATSSSIQQKASSEPSDESDNEAILRLRSPSDSLFNDGSITTCSSEGEASAKNSTSAFERGLALFEKVASPKQVLPPSAGLTTQSDAQVAPKGDGTSQDQGDGVCSREMTKKAVEKANKEKEHAMVQSKQPKTPTAVSQPERNRPLNSNEGGKATLHSGMTKPTQRAPQPNPDAASSNSLGRDRKIRSMKKPTQAEQSPAHQDKKETTEGAKSGKKEATSMVDQKPDSAVQQGTTMEATKRVIITAKKELLETSADPGGERSHDETEVDAEIVDVASTLTNVSSVSQLRTSDESGSQLIPQKTSENPKENPESMSVGSRAVRSFDTKVTASGAGVPSWRMEPSDSLSDFTIDVLFENSAETRTYHVHKHIVGIGPRRSQYFDDTFRSSTNSSAQVTMVDDAPKHFPHVLDFMYCPDYELHLTTETVIPYRYLGETLKVLPIITKTAKFILGDMKIGNLSTYITQSTTYKDEKVLKLIAAKCAESVASIPVSDSLWTAMEPSLFLRVISSPRIDRVVHSTQLSILVVEYYELHQYEMELDVFKAMTRERVIPVIDRQAAIPLLEICEQLGALEQFQKLQARCAQVMARYWKITSDGDRKRFFALLRSLPSSFTVDFLESVETGKSTLLDSGLAARSASEVGVDDDSVASWTIDKVYDNLVGDATSHHKSATRSTLSWRMEPRLSYSDWTIRVKHRVGGKDDIYHVHKHILSLGQYRSNFFAEAFLNGEHTHTKKGSTTIELSPEPASLFSALLDFMYTPNHSINIASENASALRFLSRVFGIWMLNKTVLEFVQQDMSIANMQGYLDGSDLYDDDKIVNIAVRKCAINIKEIEVDSALLRSIKPDLFGRIVSSSEIDRSATCHVNILIAKFFTLNDMDEAVLAELLKKLPLTEVDPESALSLLQVMGSVKSKDAAIFGDIRERCASVVAENWTELREEQREETFEALKTLNSTTLAGIFDAVENDYFQIQYETMTLQAKLVKRYRAQLAETKSERDAEVAALKKQMADKIAEMEATQQELEAKLRQQEEINVKRSAGFFGSLGASASLPSPKVSPEPKTRPSEPKKRSKKPSERASRIPRPTPTRITTHNVEPEVLPGEDQSSIFGRMFACSPSAPKKPSMPSTELYQSGLATTK